MKRVNFVFLVYPGSTNILKALTKPSYIKKKKKPYIVTTILYFKHFYFDTLCNNTNQLVNGQYTWHLVIFIN